MPSPFNPTTLTRSLLITAILTALTCTAEVFRLPTANRSLYDKGSGERFFVGTTGKPWESGTFGCVRSGGHQMHEGLDIRCLQRDKRGEPIDPVLATADATVAYVNRKPSLSNYGNYIILRHQIEGMEIFSVYAHLAEVRSGLKPGAVVKAGEQIGVMGRTSNTRERISKERAHVHFEINLLINDQFSQWHKKTSPKQRNDHGDWNGQNLLGLDPEAILKLQKIQGDTFSLTRYIQNQRELCRVFVRETNFPWLRRYAPLIQRNSAPVSGRIVGYEMSLNFNGIPFRLIPRTAAEVNGNAKVQLLSVNGAEAEANPCRNLVSKRGKSWQLTSHGENLLNLLTY